MQTAKEAREARRKRILERGSDRLAYITGDTSKHPSVKASPISPPQGASSIDAPHKVDEYGKGSDNDGTQAEGFESPDHVTGNVEDFQELVSVSRPLFTSQSTTEHLDMVTIPGFASSSRSLAEPTNTALVLASTSSDSPGRPVGVKVGKKSQTTFVKNLVQSIEASEGLRAVAAAVVAILIVLQTILSCCGHPWGNVLLVFLPHWPISLVFLTDFTVVIRAYILHAHSKSSQKCPGTTESEGLDGSFDKFSKAVDVVGSLEDLFNIGLLCKKAAGAISLDCSIYVVTLVCGFSLSRFTVVIGVYNLHSHYKASQKRSGTTESEGLDGSFNMFSKALDVLGSFEDLFNIGLLCKKAAGAISLDCSIYTVTCVRLQLSRYFVAETSNL